MNVNPYRSVGTFVTKTSRTIGVPSFVGVGDESVDTEGTPGDGARRPALPAGSPGEAPAAYPEV